MARPRTRRAVRESREKAEKAIEEAERAEHEGTRTATEEKTAQPSALLEGEQKSSGKRRRPKDVSPEPARGEKRQKTGSVAQSLRILLPGVPAPVSTTAYVFPDRPSGPDRGDDKDVMQDGHYQFELGDNLSSRCELHTLIVKLMPRGDKILSKMGEGTFGRVLECWDRKNKSYVAIKIVRNIKKYRDAAMIELEVLNTLESNDREGRFHCVKLLEWFDYRGHVCMVFEKLGLSLYDFLRKNSYRPFRVDFVRSFGRQLLESVAYLHNLTLIHTDLKPENILLESTEYDKLSTGGSSRKPLRVPRNSNIKVIDFGSATFDDQYHSTIVSTRHYRAPEVILGLGWTYPADIWSIGCILVELATGCALFQTHENMEHLAMMQQVLGPVPESMAVAAVQHAKMASKSKDSAKLGVLKYFSHRYRLNWPEGASGRKSVAAVHKLANLHKLLADLGDPSVKPWLEQLVDLLKKMLRYEPSARIRAKQALDHDFFRDPANGGARSSRARSGGSPSPEAAADQPAEVIVLED